MLVEKIRSTPATHIQGLIWFDTKARVVDLNLQAAHMLRAEPGWLLMQDFFSLCGQQHPNPEILAEWRDIQHGRISGVEHALVAANGAQIWVALAFSKRAAGLSGEEDRILALALNMDTFR